MLKVFAMAISIAIICSSCGSLPTTLGVTTSDGNADMYTTYMSGDYEDVVLKVAEGDKVDFEFNCPYCKINEKVENIKAPYTHFFSCNCESPKGFEVIVRIDDIETSSGSSSNDSGNEKTSKGPATLEVYSDTSRTAVITKIYHSKDVYDYIDPIETLTYTFSCPDCGYERTIKVDGACTEVFTCKCDEPRICNLIVRP